MARSTSFTSSRWRLAHAGNGTGWSAPRLPAKPNSWATQTTIHPDTKEVGRLVLGTFDGVYGLCAADMITGRVLSTPRRGSTPASRAAHPAQFLAPAGSAERTGPYRWSDAFHRSRLSPVVFVIAEDFVEPVREVLEANGVQFVGCGNMFDNYHGAASLLEGLVIYLTLQAARRSLVISYISGYKLVQNASCGRGQDRNTSIGVRPAPPSVADCPPSR
jgi:hypothetical protein